jgi:hypothetical protein
MRVRIFLVLIAILSIPAIAAPGASTGLICIALVVIGISVIDRLKELLEIAVQMRDIQLATLKRLQKEKNLASGQTGK